MRFSVFLNGRSVASEQDRSLIQSSVSHATLAAGCGFEAIFLPDHHFTGYMPVASDPMMFAAYLSAKLPDMHFGFSVTSVPLHHPVRLAERINIIDQLTDGKVLVGVGSGTTPEEMVGFGVNYAEASKISEENLVIAERLWAKRPEDPPVRFDTGHYKGEVVQRIAPTPRHARHARLMPVAMKEASARRAAENGWPAFIPAFTPPKIGGTEPLTHVRKHFGSYRTMLEAAGHPAEVVADALSWTTHTYQCVHVAASDGQARAELEEILTAYQAAIEREDEFARRVEITGANRKTESTPSALTEDWIATWCLYGSPETVVEHLRPYAELGIGNILCGTTTGPLTPRRLALADQTVRLVGSRVLPAFRGEA